MMASVPWPSSLSPCMVCQGSPVHIHRHTACGPLCHLAGDFHVVLVADGFAVAWLPSIITDRKKSIAPQQIGFDRGLNDQWNVRVSFDAAWIRCLMRASPAYLRARVQDHRRADHAQPAMTAACSGLLTLEYRSH
jgi:hypothetical protein